MRKTSLSFSNIAELFPITVETRLAFVSVGVNIYYFRPNTLLGCGLRLKSISSPYLIHVIVDYDAKCHDIMKTILNASTSEMKIIGPIQMVTIITPAKQ